MVADPIPSPLDQVPAQSRGLNANSPAAMIYAPARRGFLAEFNMMVCHYAYALSVGEDVFMDDSRAAIVWQEVFEPCVRSRSELVEQNYSRVTLCGSKLAPDEWNSRRLWVKRACDEDRIISIPAMGFHGVWTDLLLELTKRLFLPVPEIRAEAQERFVALGLASEPFGAIHIRRGDKTAGYLAANGKLAIEGEAVDVDVYISALEKMDPDIERIFIMTDDYREVATARQRYPSLDFVTLCGPTEEGYRNQDFGGLSRAERVPAIRRLLVEMLISLRCVAFAGVYLSNVSRTVAALHPRRDACCSVDRQVRWTPMP